MAERYMGPEQEIVKWVARAAAVLWAARGIPTSPEALLRLVEARIPDAPSFEKRDAKCLLAPQSKLERWGAQTASRAKLKAGTFILSGGPITVGEAVNIMQEHILQEKDLFRIIYAMELILVADGRKLCKIGQTNYIPTRLASIRYEREAEVTLLGEIRVKADLVDDLERYGHTLLTIASGSCPALGREIFNVTPAQALMALGQVKERAANF